MTGGFDAKVGYSTEHADNPRVAYDFPGGLQAQIAFNKKALVMVLRDRTADGRSLLKLLPTTWIKKVYPRDGNAGEALMSGKVTTLRPSAANSVLRLQLTRDDLTYALGLYLGGAARG